MQTVAHWVAAPGEPEIREFHFLDDTVVEKCHLMHQRPYAWLSAVASVDGITSFWDTQARGPK
jgi:hypothetical protein